MVARSLARQNKLLATAGAETNTSCVSRGHNAGDGQSGDAAMQMRNINMRSLRMFITEYFPHVFPNTCHQKYFMYWMFKYDIRVSITYCIGLFLEDANDNPIRVNITEMSGFLFLRMKACH